VATIRYAPTTSGVNSGSVTFSGGGGASASLSGSAWSVLSGLSWAASAGVIQSPFVVSNGFIYQPAEVTDPSSGGQAVYGLTSPLPEITLFRLP